MGQEILIEFVRVGDSVKVTAIDAVTGAEAVVIGPAHAARGDLEKLAVRKLGWLLGRPDDGQKPARPGVIV